MTRYLLSLVILVLAALPLAAQVSFPGFCLSDDKYYYVTITDQALQKSPAWSAEAENPPLSAQNALRLANESKAKLVRDTKDWKWKLESILLRPHHDDRWYWVMEYEQRPRTGGIQGVPRFLKLAVLMDGTVVEPKVEAGRFR
jgi:hypothetical protein